MKSNKPKEGTSVQLSMLCRSMCRGYTNTKTDEDVTVYVGCPLGPNYIDIAAADVCAGMRTRYVSMWAMNCT